MFDLTGKVALVVGGAGYLGRAVCRKLAEQGATVVIADLDRAKAESVAAELRSQTPGLRAMAVCVDIDAATSVTQALAQVISMCGHLDVAVNLAYYSTKTRVEDLSADEFDRTLRVSLTGSFLVAREAAQAMRSGGSIILFSSMYGMVAP